MSVRGRFLSLCAVLSLLSGPFPAGAQEEAKDSPAIPEPVRFESQHSGTFNGTEVAFRAVVSDIQLKRENGKAYVSVFTTAYVREGGPEDQTRPVTFVFNGGPGSASVCSGIRGRRRGVS